MLLQGQCLVSSAVTSIFRMLFLGVQHSLDQQLRGCFVRPLLFRFWIKLLHGANARSTLHELLEEVRESRMTQVVQQRLERHSHHVRVSDVLTTRPAALRDSHDLARGSCPCRVHRRYRGTPCARGSAAVASSSRQTQGYYTPRLCSKRVCTALGIA